MKRFYETVGIEKSNDGYRLTLDGRPVRTPGRRDLVLPSCALADAVGAEWDAQGETVDPTGMPNMSLAATGIDRVAPQREDVIAGIAAFAKSDLLCYRTEKPAELAARQHASWQPLLDWCAVTFNAPLSITTGLFPVTQPTESVQGLRNIVATFDDLPLAGLHEITSLSGSLVIALAVVEGRITAGEGVDAARLDETYQIERWGEDGDAMARRSNICRDFLAAVEFLRLCSVLN
ncbi:MAG: ATPase [Rhodospirillaceae bacterium]|nr:ATPase [Rhodospirillaceae bacterium]